MGKLCKSIANSESFQSLILFLILLTAASMGLETVPELMDRYDWLFAILFIVTQVVFAFEIVVRLMAHSPNFRGFFNDFWNTFDFTIVTISFLPGIGSFALIARLLRVLRVLRVLSVSDRMRGFIDRLDESVDELVYSAIILLVLGYIFSIAGHYSFFECDPAHWATLGRSALSVFYLMLLQDVPSYVGPALEFSKLAIFYFLIFYLTMISFFISVINAAIAQSVAKNNE